jgi:hypothetical protein
MFAKLIKSQGLTKLLGLTKVLNFNKKQIKYLINQIPMEQNLIFFCKYL